MRTCSIQMVHIFRITLGVAGLGEMGSEDTWEHSNAVCHRIFSWEFRAAICPSLAFGDVIATSVQSG